MTRDTGSVVLNLGVRSRKLTRNPGGECRKHLPDLPPDVCVKQVRNSVKSAAGCIIVLVTCVSGAAEFQSSVFKTTVVKRDQERARKLRG